MPTAELECRLARPGAGALGAPEPPFLATSASSPLHAAQREGL